MGKIIRQECGNCRHGKFSMTKHTPPRINSSVSGRCTWPEPEHVLPKCIADHPLNKVRFSRQSIWPHDQSCPCWESKEATKLDTRDCCYWCGERINDKPILSSEDFLTECPFCSEPCRRAAELESEK